MINCLELISRENLITVAIPPRYWLFFLWTIFRVICFLFILPAVYCLFCSGVLDCSPAIHQGSAFHYLVQSDETKKGFWLPWLIPPPHSSQQRCSLYFSPYASDQLSLDSPVKNIYMCVYAPLLLNDPVFTADFPECCHFYNKQY